jgi:hypothetical protein
MKMVDVLPTVSSHIEQQPSADASISKWLPDHLRQIPGKPWAFWNWACLRGAGFPAHLTLSMSLEACAAAADALFHLEKRIDEKRAEMIDISRTAFAQLGHSYLLLAATVAGLFLTYLLPAEPPITLNAGLACLRISTLPLMGVWL